VPTDSNSIAERAVAVFTQHSAPAEPKGWGVGSDAVIGSGLAREPEAAESAATLELAHRFQAALFDAGLAWLHGPAEYGGAELDRAEIAEYRRIAARFEPVDTSVFMIGQRIVAPAILAFGSTEQKERYLRGLFRGEIVGCQLFSEPDAGSDLASLRCRAVRTDGGWLITGQKVWSSGAHHADVGELLVRTDDDLTLRNRGLTMFLIDMAAPEVTVKPLRQMNGNSHFNEVFVDNLFVTDEAILGELGGGWAVANASLSSERDLEPDDAGLFLDLIDRLLELADVLGPQPDSVRQDLARAVSRERIAGWMRQTLERADPAVAAASASLLKLYEAQSVWDIAQIAAAILGPMITADDGEWGHYAWSDLVLGAHSQRIAGGTDEIQRNIVGERALGLPREPRP
jgi:acyl-CoA dehydrogenase